MFYINILFERGHYWLNPADFMPLVFGSIEKFSLAKVVGRAK